jgi:hypothetical protein
VLPPAAPGVIHIQPLRGCAEKNILGNIIEVFWANAIFNSALTNKMRINSFGVVQRKIYWGILLKYFGQM